jgi:hypothetical protein
MGMALAISLAFSGSAPAAATGAREFSPPPAATNSAGAGGSRRVAPSVADAPIQSFLTVEPFELRHEVMLRLPGLTGALSLDDAAVIPIVEQPALAGKLASFVLDHTAVRVDGKDVPASMRRVDFMSVDPTGALPRTKPIPESLAEAVVGVVIAYPVEGMAQTADLTWRGIPTSIQSIPVTVIDPETVRTNALTAGEPMMVWKNNLSEDPIPKVSTIAVERPRILVPWLSLVGLALVLVLAVLGIRRRRPFIVATARVLLALAFIAGPLMQTAVALPGFASRVPSERQARRILSGLLPNVYRALEYRQESAVYDHLSHSLIGDTLRQVYLELRRGLELEERGGAQARVEAVEVLEASAIESSGNGFSVRAIWHVGGLVTHFGHRHFRQNRYDARIGIVPRSGTWKIRSLEILELERIQ